MSLPSSKIRVYSQSSLIALKYSYVSTARKVARERMAVAGYRLGALLNSVYGQ